MALVLELRTDQGNTLELSFQDDATVFSVQESANNRVMRQKLFSELRTGNYVMVVPGSFMEIVNARRD